jgi:hypothetical protein
MPVVVDECASLGVELGEWDRDPFHAA